MTILQSRQNRTNQITLRISDEEKRMKDELFEGGFNVSHIFRESLKSAYCQFKSIDNNWDDNDG